jgi:hypothetical protein
MKICSLDAWSRVYNLVSANRLLKRGILGDTGDDSSSTLAIWL